MTKKQISKRYVVICGTCYTCVLAETSNRKEANLAATGHMNAYCHETWITDRKKGPK